MSSVDVSLSRQIEAICPGRVRARVSLGVHSWWKIGGPVRLMVEPASISELAELRKIIGDAGLRTLVIGEMSNLLITDAPINAIAIKMGGHFSDMERLGPADISVQAGAWVPGVARALQRQGLTGLEHICGIPGTIGGLVMMNGGSLRQSIGANVVSVTTIDADGQSRIRSQAECEFAYRTSVFSSLNEIIAEVTLRLKPGDSLASRRQMQSILRARRLKFPRKWPNCGSVFKSDPASYSEHGPPGAMIERAGWKGASRGHAQVSPVHANFIINRGGAEAADILSLICDIQKSVEDMCGHRMEPEVRYVDKEGRICPADEVHRRTLKKRIS